MLGQKFTIAGTTDKPCKISFNPSPTENDIQFILNEIKKYLNPDVNVRRGDVMSAWSGIRFFFFAFLSLLLLFNLLSFFLN